jgi:hypothetical protein
MLNVIVLSVVMLSAVAPFKTLRIRNLRQICCNLVPFLLSVTNTLAWTSTQNPNIMNL